MNELIVEKQKENIRYGQGTLVIILINLIVFVALNIFPSLGEKILLSHELSLILEKPWTLVTVIFSHEIFIHLILNMSLFFFFGSRLEKITNTKTVWIVYLISGLMGSITFLFTGLIIERGGFIAGASSAVLGVASAFSVLRPDTVILKSKAKWWVLSLIVFSIFPIFIIPQTLDSGVAHITGILVGLISGYFLKRNEKTINSLHD